MKKILTATVLVAALAVPTAASADGPWNGPMVGGTVVAPPSYYPPAVYAPARVYYFTPGPVQYEIYIDPYARAYDPCLRRVRSVGCK
jgi:hypothetical protein